MAIFVAGINRSGKPDLVLIDTPPPENKPANEYACEAAAYQGHQGPFIAFENANELRSLSTAIRHSKDSNAPSPSQELHVESVVVLGIAPEGQSEARTFAVPVLPELVPLGYHIDSAKEVAKGLGLSNPYLVFDRFAMDNLIRHEREIERTLAKKAQE